LGLRGRWEWRGWRVWVGVEDLAGLLGGAGGALPDEVEMRWLLAIVRPFGLAARMSADQHAEYNIGVNENGLSCSTVPW
jgi:hypothetical protein